MIEFLKDIWDFLWSNEVICLLGCSALGTLVAGYLALLSNKLESKNRIINILLSVVFIIPVLFFSIFSLPFMFLSVPIFAPRSELKQKEKELEELQNKYNDLLNDSRTIADNKYKECQKYYVEPLRNKYNELCNTYNSLLADYERLKSQQGEQEEAD